MQKGSRSGRRCGSNTNTADAAPGRQGSLRPQRASRFIIKFALSREHRIKQTGRRRFQSLCCTDVGRRKGRHKLPLHDHLLGLARLRQGRQHSSTQELRLVKPQRSQRGAEPKLDSLRRSDRRPPI
jgi:hypothetical protein